MYLPHILGLELSTSINSCAIGLGAENRHNSVFSFCGNRKLCLELILISLFIDTSPPSPQAHVEVLLD
jgi:hypothetical protein